MDDETEDPDGPRDRSAGEESSPGQGDSGQQSGEKQCTNCGAPLGRDSKFCTECGTEQNPERYNSNQQQGGQSGTGARGQRRQGATRRQQGPNQQSRNRGQRGRRQRPRGQGQQRGRQAGHSRQPDRMAVAGPGSSTGLAAATHILALFTGLLGPILIYAVTDDPFVKENAAKATDWQIMLIIYSFISGLLVLLIVGIFFLLALLVLDLVFIAIAAIKAVNGEAWSYPITPELL